MCLYASPLPNPNEVCDWRYTSFEQIKMEIEMAPETFTYWFKLVYERVFKYMHTLKQ